MAEIFRAEKSLQLRSLDQLEHGIDLDRTIVVTSNWDDCVWSDKRFKHLIYLHGHCKIKNSIVLPTQFVTDEYPLKYWIDLQYKNSSYEARVALGNVKLISGWLKVIPDLPRGDEQDVQLELSYAHDLLREVISCGKLKRMLIWGYGFNLYDAEVNLLLTLASQMYNPKIEIINPDPTVLLKAAQVLAVPINNIGYHHPSK